MSTTNPSLKVLIVCLGNICRSPMGEAVLRHIANERGITIEVDSCGTGDWHIGYEPDERTVSTCQKHGVPISRVARLIKTSDFTTFTHILAADESNLRDLNRVKPSNATAEVRLWGSYFDDKAIPDPYDGEINGFEAVFRQCTSLSNAFLDEVNNDT